MSFTLSADMGRDHTVMADRPQRQEDAQLTGDFEMLDADLDVDLSNAEESPNPLTVASDEDLRWYWRRLQSVITASLGTDAPRGRR